MSDNRNTLRYPDPSKGLGVVTLLIVGTLAALFGLFSSVLGTSAVHQILTGVYFLIFTICAGCLAIIRAIAKATTVLQAETRDAVRDAVEPRTR